MSEEAGGGIGGKLTRDGRRREKVLGERDDVGEAVTERRQRDRDDADPVVEVLAEASVADGGRQVAVGGGDDPDVDRDGAAADRGHDALLQRAQQLGLHGEIHVADLVEEQGAAVRLAKEAGTVGGGAGEGAADMAEEQAFEQLGGNGGAVDGHEGGFRAASMTMDLVGDDLLAGAGLAHEQDRGVAVGDEADGLLDVTHRGTGADEGAGRGRRRCARTIGEHAVEEGANGIAADGLGEVVDGAEAHRLDRVVAGGHGGEDRHGRRAGAAADGAQHGQAIHARHAQIEQDGVGAMGGEPGECRGSVGGFGRTMAEIGDGGRERAPERGVVVDDEDGVHSVSANNAPSPGPPARSSVS